MPFKSEAQRRYFEANKTKLEKHGVDVEECAADILCESKVRFPVAAVEPVIENPTDAARLIAVLEVKIFVAPRLVPLVRGDRGVGVASRGRGRPGLRRFSGRVRARNR